MSENQPVNPTITETVVREFPAWMNRRPVVREVEVPNPDWQPPVDDGVPPGA